MRRILLNPTFLSWWTASQAAKQIAEITAEIEAAEAAGMFCFF